MMARWKISGTPYPFKAFAAIGADGFAGFKQIQVNTGMPDFFAVSVTTRSIFVNKMNLIMWHVVLLLDGGSRGIFVFFPIVFLRIFLREEKQDRVPEKLQAYIG